MDEIEDSIKSLTIDDAEYFESNTATASDAQGNLTSHPETVTHASNIIFEQKLLSCRTIPILPPPTNLGIASIILPPPMLVKPTTKEIVAHAVSSSACTSRILRQVSSTGDNGSTPCNIDNAISIVETPSPALIVIIGTVLPCDLNLIQEVGDVRQYTSPGLVRQSQKNERYR